MPEDQDDEHPELDLTIDDGLADRPEFRLEPLRLNRREVLALTYGGLVFLAAAIAGLVALSILMFRLVDTKLVTAMLARSTGGGQTSVAAVVDFYLALFLAPLILLVASGVASLIAYSLLRAGGAAGRESVPAQDYSLLERLLVSGSTEGITSYVRLRSLTGLSGFFNKVGLTGLPLATIGLTCFFAIIGFFNQAFLDLAKLTLGAFLGSYVQRRASEMAESVNRQPPAA